MPFVPFAQVAQVQMVYAVDAQICENVFHVHLTTEYDPGSLGNLVNDFLSWWGANLKALQGPQTALIKIIATALHSRTAPMVETAVVSSNIGTHSGSPLSNNCALACTWVTGSRGRSYRGRTFHTGLTDTMLDSASKNKMNGTYLTALTAAYDALLTAMSGSSQELGVASRRQNKVWLSTGVFTPIDHVAIDDTIDSQRRRLPGRGR